MSKRVDVTINEEWKQRLQALVTNLVSALDIVTSYSEDRLKDNVSGEQCAPRVVPEPSIEFLVPLSNDCA